MVPLSKSGVRKHRGFESRPLRQPRPPTRRRQRPAPRSHLGCARSGARRSFRNCRSGRARVRISPSRLWRRTGKRFGAPVGGFESRSPHSACASPVRCVDASGPRAHGTCGCARAVLGSALARPPRGALGPFRFQGAPALRRRRGDGLSFPSRARRGTSGALYLQSAIAGLNPLPRSPFSDAARRATLRTGSRASANREPCQVRKEAALSDHRRVPRNGLVRAARHGGHEERSGRRRVHGNSTAARPPRIGGGRDADRAAPGALPALACPDIRGDRRPGSGRRDAPERRPRGPGQPRRPLRRAARHGQDLAGPDPGQGRQLHRPPGRRRLRPLSVVRVDP